MEESIRKPFEGTWNIIRFNRHFYVLAGSAIACLMVGAKYVFVDHRNLLYAITTLIVFSIVLSLLVSAYIYDISGLYRLSWLDGFTLNKSHTIINIHAGFDETSCLLANKFPDAQLVVLDMYDPVQQTEISIKRARKAYPAYPGTKAVCATAIPITNEVADVITVIFAAHEIRAEALRHKFFAELKRLLKPDGKIIITEHLRNVPNLIAYNIGFFHFMCDVSWRRSFKEAGLTLTEEKQHTRFIKIYILQQS